VIPLAPKMALLFAVEASGSTTSFALPTRVLWPSNVTRAFSETHERLAELKRSRMVLADSGMEKLVWAVVIRRDMDSPTVTLGSCAPNVAVVHPVAPLTVHVAPLNPLMQIQEQAPLDKKVVPPFWHFVAVSVAHCCKGLTTAAADVVALFLCMTTISNGITTAAAIMMRSRRITTQNTQTGIPHQRRFLAWTSFSAVRPPKDGSSYSAAFGHEETGRTGVTPRVGVASPGGGKAASMPERPDWCFSSPVTRSLLVVVKRQCGAEMTYCPSPFPGCPAHSGLGNHPTRDGWQAGVLDPSWQLVSWRV
jgi:hypothetical protein